MANACRECARLQDMIRIRREQLDTAVRLLDDHLAGIDDDGPLVVIRPGVSVKD